MVTINRYLLYRYLHWPDGSWCCIWNRMRGQGLNCGEVIRTQLQRYVGPDHGPGISLTHSCTHVSPHLASQSLRFYLHRLCYLGFYNPKQNLLSISFKKFHTSYCFNTIMLTGSEQPWSTMFQPQVHKCTSWGQTRGKQRSWAVMCSFFFFF